MYTRTFDTALGLFGIGWTDRGLARLLLPGGDHHKRLERLNRGAARPGEPTGDISALIGLIKDYASGREVDFSGIALDLTDVPNFHRRAYGLLTRVGWGETVTYGDLARQLGDVGLSRAVGQAMGANPIPLIIPCHRVLAGDGTAGGFSAPGGASTKARMLALEGVHVGTPKGQMRFGF